MNVLSVSMWLLVRILLVELLLVSKENVDIASVIKICWSFSVCVFFELPFGTDKELIVGHLCCR